jgi:hypothetical protein
VLKLWRISVLLCLLGCAHAREKPPPKDAPRATAHYTVTIFDNFGGAKVRLCFEGATVRQLVPIGDSEGRALRRAWIEDDKLDTTHGRIRLRHPLRASCIDYETRFGTPIFRASDSAAVIVSQTEWLWRPDPFPHELDTSVRFVLPADRQVSLPWPRADAIYFPEQSAFFTSVYGVFGSFERQAFSVGSTSIDIARLGPRPPDDDTCTSSSCPGRAKGSRWSSGWCVEAAACRFSSFRRPMRRSNSSKQIGWLFTSFHIFGYLACTLGTAGSQKGLRPICKRCCERVVVSKAANARGRVSERALTEGVGRAPGASWPARVAT